MRCRAGAYLEEGTQQCVLCPEGSFSTSPNKMNSCSPCPSGQFQSQRGQTSCSVCDVDAGFYQNGVGASACLSCYDMNFPCPPLFSLPSSPPILSDHLVYVLCCIVLASSAVQASQRAECDAERRVHHRLHRPARTAGLSALPPSLFCSYCAVLCCSCSPASRCSAIAPPSSPPRPPSSRSD